MIPRTFTVTFFTFLPFLLFSFSVVHFLAVVSVRPAYLLHRTTTDERARTAWQVVGGCRRRQVECSESGCHTATYHHQHTHTDTHTETY